MTVQTELSELLIQSNTNKVAVMAMIVSHASLSETSYITDHFPGFTGNLPSGEAQFFQYAPLRVDRENKGENLAYERRVLLQDLNEIIVPMVERIPLDSTEPLLVDILTYIVREDGVVSSIQDGPYNLIGDRIGINSQGASFVATAKQTVDIGTGEKGDVTRVPFYEQFL